MVIRSVLIEKEVEEFFSGKLEEVMEKFRMNDSKGLEIMDYFLSKSSFADKVQKTRRFLDWKLILDKDGRKKLFLELLVETKNKELIVVRVKIPMIMDD